MDNWIKNTGLMPDPKIRVDLQFSAPDEPGDLNNPMVGVWPEGFDWATHIPNDVLISAYRITDQCPCCGAVYDHIVCGSYDDSVSIYKCGYGVSPVKEYFDCRHATKQRGRKP